MLRFALFALLGATTLSACAQPASPTGAAAAPAKPAVAAAGAPGEQRVRAALLQLDPNFKPDFIGAAPFPGFREVVVGGQVLYVSDDGRYLFQAQPFDIQERQVASSEGLLSYRRKLLESAPRAERIVFAPTNPKYTISVFTDIECGYCRKLHSEIAELNKQGIAVEYLAFPRMGLGSQDYKDMVAVWCAADKKKALTEAKANGKVPSATSCKNPVTMQYNLGQRLGVNGTPAIFAPDGTQLGGYLPPAQLREALDKRAAEAGRAGGSR
ncbi:DsbC family protein [Xanthomonas translucens]|uniref:Thiol:disulfide interchange protein n=1 Tax=Xanthomonas translucens pv. translucens DSM 18974 TaxID=1261556 RepID=A0A1C3TSL0_XANCT|nr:DsbC family protein [Xanthomonas translucens]MCC8447801.1 DsbC family protein [Xanthomonas translucens pv. translucens]MCT8286386.1 DsbC family protein [Xanthomonas translucens pv. translucens]MCT8304044.1 DsbC family protein [Xanthomonas translucens pv. translucens]UNT97893.1 DsbC family protein [Xanthomonas translucens pv. translucens]UNU10509.1 DsbC family protein [Xanthomonas translucens pv. translucens]